jgi:uncharacterized protein (DUF427 family)
MLNGKWLVALMIVFAVNIYAAERVCDYPQSPKVEETSKNVKVVFNDAVIAETTHAIRVLQKDHPPVYYIPQQDIQMKYLTATSKTSTCEFKGKAFYYDINVGSKAVAGVGWTYPEPTKGYEAIKNYIAFYPGKMDACYVDGERVTPEPGDYFGGWVTKDIVVAAKDAPMKSQ